jgi:ZIP family zinc transporter
MPLAVQAGQWRLLRGSALILGALAGYFARISTRWIAGIMTFAVAC